MTGKKLEKRNKLGQFIKGNVSYFLGKHQSKETRAKKFRATTRRTLTEEHKLKLSISHKGQVSFWKGKKLSIEHRKKISLSTRGKPKKPVELLRKKGRQAEMGRWKYVQWRNSVFKRDDYTCVMCGIRGLKMNADHIIPWSKSDKLRYEISNGRTVCLNCHRNIHRKLNFYANKKTTSFAQL
jgi:hypothetical protein